MRVTFAAITVGLLGLAGVPALSADLPPAVDYRAPAQVVAERFTWTGVYVGANAGYAWNSGHSNGVIGGGQIGGNWQIGMAVLGVEADLQAAGIKHTGNLTNTTGLVISETSSINYFGTARGRLGIALDRWLIYGTGGAAFTTIKRSGIGVVGEVGTYSVSNDRMGWTAGGGAEWAFADHWSVKLEYLYLHFPAYTNTYVVTLVPGAIVNYSARVENVARAGLNYRF